MRQRPQPRHASRPPFHRACALLALVLGLVGAGPGRAAPDPLPGRALWVWSEPSAAEVQLAVRQGFDTLYVQLRPGHVGRRELRTLSRRARRRGVGVWGLGGRKEWVLEPQALTRFVRRAARTPGLEGIVLDVEPYTLPGWSDPNRRRSLMRAFLRALDRAAAAAGDTTLLAAIPFWYDHDGYRVRGRSLLDCVLERTDGVVVLAYRDRADGDDGIVALARREVARAGELRKGAVVSVQTAPDVLDKLSFAEEGRAVLERELQRVQDEMLGLPGFAGLAVHHYESFRTLWRR